MSAYTYPLLIKNLLNAPVVDDPHQEIVYRDQVRLTYAEFRQRVCRLANALSAIGAKPGDTVAVMDFDSHRYLECFHAVPMLGAVLHTINIRLSPEQILYTIDHVEDDYLLVHEELLPLLEQIRGRIDTVKGYVLLQYGRQLLVAILHMLMSHPVFDATDLSNWKVLVVGADLPKAMCRAALQKVINVFTGYGMSESCPILTVAHVTEEDLTEDQ